MGQLQTRLRITEVMSLPRFLRSFPPRSLVRERYVGTTALVFFVVSVASSPRYGVNRSAPGIMVGDLAIRICSRLICRSLCGRQSSHSYLFSNDNLPRFFMDLPLDLWSEEVGAAALDKYRHKASHQSGDRRSQTLWCFHVFICTVLLQVVLAKGTQNINFS